jgi:hypothetical protein
MHENTRLGLASENSFMSIWRLIVIFCYRILKEACTYVACPDR